MLLSLMLIVLFLTMLSGFPVAFALGGVSLIFAFIGVAAGQFDVSMLQALPLRIYGLMRNELLIAIPLFVFMGTLLQGSGAAHEMLTAINRLCRRLPAGLGIALMLVGAMLAASTGIVGATVVTMGLISLPAMLDAGYDKKLACGGICAAGTLGQIIPPSIVLILLADQISGAYQATMMEIGNFAADPVSVSDIFGAALVPGLALVVCYMLWFLLIGITKPEKAPAYKEPAVCPNSAKAVCAFRAIIPPALLIMAVLGTILFGLATVTEAASAGAFGAFIITVCKRKFSLKLLRESSRETGGVTAMLFTLLIGATIFSLVFRGFGGEHIVHDMLSNLPGGMMTGVFIVLLVMFVLGFFLDFIEIIYIVVPMVTPVLVKAGADPVWLATLIALNLQTSFLTPPFGFSLFYLKSVAPKQVTTPDIYKGVLPFIVIQLLVLGLVFFFPKMALFASADRAIVVLPEAATDAPFLSDEPDF